MVANPGAADVRYAAILASRDCSAVGNGPVLTDSSPDSYETPGPSYEGPAQGLPEASVEPAETDDPEPWTVPSMDPEPTSIQPADPQTWSAAAPPSTAPVPGPAPGPRTELDPARRPSDVVGGRAAIDGPGARTCAGPRTELDPARRPSDVVDGPAAIDGPGARTCAGPRTDLDPARRPSDVVGGRAATTAVSGAAARTRRGTARCGGRPGRSVPAVPRPHRVRSALFALRHRLPHLRRRIRACGAHARLRVPLLRAARSAGGAAHAPAGHLDVGGGDHRGGGRTGRRPGGCGGRFEQPADRGGEVLPQPERAGQAG